MAKYAVFQRRNKKFGAVEVHSLQPKEIEKLIARAAGIPLQDDGKSGLDWSMYQAPSKSNAISQHTMKLSSPTGGKGGELNHGESTGVSMVSGIPPEERCGDSAAEMISDVLNRQSNHMQRKVREERENKSGRDGRAC